LLRCELWMLSRDLQFNYGWARNASNRNRIVEPFLPTPPGRSKGGRPRVPDRACLTGILFVLRSGIPWQVLPQELGSGSDVLASLARLTVWDLIHFALRD